MLRPSILLVLCTVIACSSKGEGPAATPDSGVDPLTALLGEGPAASRVNLAPACGTVGTPKLSFAKRTTEWGLTAVRGNHLQAIDLDNDGYPDLLVQSGGSARSPVGDKQATRVLMNRPGAGGGRTFVEATVDSGFGAVREGSKPADGLLRASQLVVAADVDNDGDVDLFSGTYVDPTKPENDSSDRNEILLNDGKGKFALASKSAVQQVPSDVLPPTSSATFVDVDRDGIVDLFVGFWYRAYGTSYLGVQARLFKGVGDGTFTDATPGSGLETATSGYDQGKNHRPAYGVTSCDLDDDGAPELMVSAYGRQYNLLYKNHSASGAPAFEDVSTASGFAGDSLVDYADNQFYMCHCKITGSCTAGEPDLSCGTTSNWSTVDAKPWRNNGNTFTTTCGDLNADGKPDLYSAEIVHWHIGSSSDPSELLVNESADGAIKFGRPGRKNTGLEWPHPTVDWNEGGIMSANADLDLDGYDDIVVAASDYPGNWSMLFRQKPDAPGTFEEIGESVGLHHICTNGVAIADFDRDGDLDVVVGSSTARDCAKSYPGGNEVHFYENKLNDGADKAGYLQIALEGKGAGFANKTGIGARVKVVNAGKVQSKQLLGGYGHFGIQHDTALSFGLGASCEPTAIEVRWPNGELTRARFTGVGGGRRILIKESGEVTEVAR